MLSGRFQYSPAARPSIAFVRFFIGFKLFVKNEPHHRNRQDVQYARHHLKHIREDPND